jgi:hypothetical protein
VGFLVISLNKVMANIETIPGNKLSKSFVSQVCHLLSFEFKKASPIFDKTMFIISVDVDVGCKQIGLLNKGENDANVNRYFSEFAIGKVEEIALPLFVDLFEKTGIPVTFAVRGQLVETHPESISCLLDSPIHHDIGSHGYSHKRFTLISEEEAEAEMNKTSAAFDRIGVTPKSFIFPRNCVNHLSALEKYGFKCYRSNGGGLLHDTMKIEKYGTLYNIYPSMLLDQNTDLFFIKHFLNVTLAKKGPLHFWFHTWNFGMNEKAIKNNLDRILYPLLEYAKQKERMGLLSFETMLSAADKTEMFGSDFAPLPVSYSE